VIHELMMTQHQTVISSRRTLYAECARSNNGEDWKAHTKERIEKNSSTKDLLLLLLLLLLLFLRLILVQTEQLRLRSTRMVYVWCVLPISRGKQFVPPFQRLTFYT